MWCAFGRTCNLVSKPNLHLVLEAASHRKAEESGRCNPEFTCHSANTLAGEHAHVATWKFSFLIQGEQMKQTTCIHAFRHTDHTDRPPLS